DKCVYAEYRSTISRIPSAGGPIKPDEKGTKSPENMLSLSIKGSFTRQMSTKTEETVQAAANKRIPDRTCDTRGANIKGDAHGDRDLGSSGNNKQWTNRSAGDR
ncbi:unnamed protein product, partial [Gordionus sp. m RMFG-2023]